jgi:transposase InsO family protein
VRLAKTTAKEGQMQLHANAKLGLSGRCALVRAIEGGLSVRAAAAAFSVSPATAHRWWRRWLAAGRERAALHDRSSRPRRCPRRLTAAEEEPILRARRETNLGPARLAGIVRRARSTIWKVLHRHGLSRRQRGERRRYRRYEWSRPGALLHMDVKKLARFAEPGHRVTGDRREIARNRGAGYAYLHCVVDDHSRFAHVELHPREDAETNARTLERALAELAALGLEPPEAVMTDRAFVYTKSCRFRELLAGVGARHIVTPPYTPRWNGKVEAFINTLQQEWAYVREWSSSGERALASFDRYYNRRRPHSSLRGRPPISRVHNLRGQLS